MRTKRERSSQFDQWNQVLWCVSAPQLVKMSSDILTKYLCANMDAGNRRSTAVRPVIEMKCLSYTKWQPRRRLSCCCYIVSVLTVIRCDLCRVQCSVCHCPLFSVISIMCIQCLYNAQMSRFI